MEDPPADPNHDLPTAGNRHLSNADSELDSLRTCYKELQSRSMVGAEETLEDLRTELLDADASSKDQEESNLKERLDLASEIGVLKARVSGLLEESRRKYEALTEILDSVQSVKGCLIRMLNRIGDEELEEKIDFEDTFDALLMESRLVRKLGIDAEDNILEYEERTIKEKKELENSIVSLTEENRDFGSLLRIALAEKKAVEESLSRLKGSGEQKRGAILQIAERGLQKVGFGFMMGAAAAAAGESQSNQLSTSAVCMKSELSTSAVSMKSDGCECEEESVTLASTVEQIMKNLRREKTDLRRFLEESRSDCERLQSLADKQAQKITESTEYIKYLEERENLLAQKVEELMGRITEAGEEVARWREACEWEVEAGKTAIEEREREVAILQGELKRMRAALDAATSQLNLKERLAATAMAAQVAAEASLRLADSRCAGLRERIEELTRQVEEEADRSKKERSISRRRKVRHMCWPWGALKLTSAPQSAAAAASCSGNRSRKMLPEMEALLHISI